MEHTIKLINDANFDTEVIESPGLFILKLCRDRTCDPHSFDKIEEELANEYQGDVRFGLLDTEENHYTANRLLASEKDAYIFFKENQEIARFGADLNKEELKKLIHEHFGY